LFVRSTLCESHLKRSLLWIDTARATGNTYVWVSV
jgi:hypothetical protein